MAKKGRRGGRGQGNAKASDALAAATAQVAGLVAGTERDEERLAGRLAGRLPPQPRPERARRRALLIINTKSGPQNDSLGRVREVVDLLARQGIDVDVRVKLRKKQARAEARRAAGRGVPLVIAAGGDGTVEAVAAGLVGSERVLGIVPLGTYNNVAGCLGLPFDAAEACALIGAGPMRRIDVGRVTAQGRKRPRVFLEMAAVGVTAALMPAGQDAKKGAWDTAAQAVPDAVAMRPTPAVLRMDGSVAERQAHTLLVEVANAPLMGPAFRAAPHARMDDGLLDVAVYHDLSPAGLARPPGGPPGRRPGHGRAHRALPRPAPRAAHRDSPAGDGGLQGDRDDPGPLRGAAGSPACHRRPRSGPPPPGRRGAT